MGVKKKAKRKAARKPRLRLEDLRLDLAELRAALRARLVATETVMQQCLRDIASVKSLVASLSPREDAAAKEAEIRHLATQVQVTDAALREKADRLVKSHERVVDLEGKLVASEQSRKRLLEEIEDLKGNPGPPNCYVGMNGKSRVIHHFQEDEHGWVCDRCGVKNAPVTG